jgi:hypothetical protein
MKKNIIKLAMIATFSFAIASCKKDPATPTPTPKEGTVLLEFSNKVGTDNLKMDGTVYKNQNGDDFTISKFNYYISNIKLNNTDGSSFSEVESYHLVEQNIPSSLNFSLAKVPAGTYKSITFTIGVDSLRNVSGAQTGALDPAKGMFWSWSTGYIMVKLEGTSPQSTQPDNKYQLHAGGFQGTNNTIRTLTLNLPNNITINGDENHIHLTADVQKLLGNPNPIKFGITSVIMSAGVNAKNLADNYAGMFSITAAGK